MKNSGKLFLPALLIIAIMINGCKKDEEQPSPTGGTPVPQPEQVFKCKINDTLYTATYVVTQGSYAGSEMVPYAKGLKTTNGTSAITGDIQMTLSFGTDSLANMNTGVHSVEASLSGGDNKGKATFKDIKYNGLYCWVKPGEGTITVDSYYTSTTQGWQGGKGSFSNIKIYTMNVSTMEQDSVVLTEGVFDYKYSY